MAAPVKQLSDLNPGGTGLGQSTSDLISFYGVTPVVQQSSTALATITTTTSILALVNKLVDFLVTNGLVGRT